MQYVSYRRVSTSEQGKSGLGLEAQQAAIAAFLRPGDSIIGDYVDVQSGSIDERPELARAVRRCKRTGATLVISTLDRLSRDSAYIGAFIKQGCQFRAADRPNASTFELHIYAAVAEEERRKIGERTRAALAAAKARGVQLGGDRGYRPDSTPAAFQHGPAASAVARSRKAVQTAYGVAGIITEIQQSGTTSQAGIAAALNGRQVPTPRGTGQWTATAVRRVMARLEAAGGDD